MAHLEAKAFSLLLLGFTPLLKRGVRESIGLGGMGPDRTSDGSRQHGIGMDGIRSIA